MQMDSSRPRRVIAAGMIGNVLEWYDFAVYGYFATAIGWHSARLKAATPPAPV